MLRGDMIHDNAGYDLHPTEITADDFSFQIKRLKSFKSNPMTRGTKRLA